MKIKRICEECGKEFYVIPSIIKIGKGRFCSQKCLGTWHSKNMKGKNSPRWKGGKIKRICIICKKEFYKDKNELKNNHGKFCSQKCFGKWQSQNKKGAHSPTWKGGKIKCICKICKKEFEKFPSRIKNGRGKFCSKICNGIGVIKYGKKKDTVIELLIEQELIKNKIPYIKQCPVEHIAIVDFLLPNKIIIQADGDYWHNLPNRQNRDINQDTILGFKGYKVYRFWEHEIKKSAKKCLEKIYGLETRN